jgi:hypothetical protein
MITNFKIASVLAITVFACMFYCATNWWDKQGLVKRSRNATNGCYYRGS